MCVKRSLDTIDSATAVSMSIAICACHCAVRSSALQCIAVCCSVFQCVAVCNSAVCIFTSVSSLQNWLYLNPTPQTRPKSKSQILSNVMKFCKVFCKFLVWRCAFASDGACNFAMSFENFSSGALAASNVLQIAMSHIWMSHVPHT